MGTATKIFGLLLVVAGLLIGGSMIWAIANEPEMKDFILLGGVVSAAFVALGCMAISDH